MTEQKIPFTVIITSLRPHSPFSVGCLILQRMITHRSTLSLHFTPPHLPQRCYIFLCIIVTPATLQVQRCTVAETSEGMGGFKRYLARRVRARCVAHQPRREEFRLKNVKVSPDRRTSFLVLSLQGRSSLFPRR